MPILLYGSSTTALLTYNSNVGLSRVQGRPYVRDPFAVILVKHVVCDISSSTIPSRAACSLACQVGRSPDMRDELTFALFPHPKKFFLMHCGMEFGLLHLVLLETQSQCIANLQNAPIFVGVGDCAGLCCMRKCMCIFHSSLGQWMKEEYGVGTMGVLAMHSVPTRIQVESRALESLLGKCHTVPDV
eukprot:jgi/Botrbrau1/18688/Bobra.0386s0016.1